MREVTKTLNSSLKPRRAEPEGNNYRTFHVEKANRRCSEAERLTVNL
jgi:hypothetical protein